MRPEEGIDAIDKRRRAEVQQPSAFHISVDVDYLPGTEQAAERLINELLEAKVVPSVFVAGRAASALGTSLTRWADEGCEFGVHGWNHCVGDEDFRSMSIPTQRELIERAGTAIELASGVRPMSFRAPNLWVEPAIGTVLAPTGIKCDSSVPSGRCDLIVGRIRTPRFLFAPRTPYEVDPSCCTRRGRSGVVEVPLVSAIVPVNMMALRLFGPATLAALSVIIARLSGYVMFYCHPAEICKNRPGSVAEVPRRHRYRSGPAALTMLLDYIRRLERAGLFHTSLSNLVARADSPDVR